jgi:hypothetical protein
LHRALAYLRWLARWRDHLRTATLRKASPAELLDSAGDAAGFDKGMPYAILNIWASAERHLPGRQSFITLTFEWFARFPENKSLAIGHRI